MYRVPPPAHYPGSPHRHPGTRTQMYCASNEACQSEKHAGNDAGDSGVECGGEGDISCDPMHLVHARMCLESEGMIQHNSGRLDANGTAQPTSSNQLDPAWNERLNWTQFNTNDLVWRVESWAHEHTARLETLIEACTPARAAYAQRAANAPAAKGYPPEDAETSGYRVGTQCVQFLIWVPLAGGSGEKDEMKRKARAAQASGVIAGGAGLVKSALQWFMDSESCVAGMGFAG
ncbi:hypothetical protein C8R43DRAFT_942853 [Mycena crocata]|nr:hypothetical protein C8R43DRAFT_942853 [Mycena crocata]